MTTEEKQGLFNIVWLLCFIVLMALATTKSGWRIAAAWAAWNALRVLAKRFVWRPPPGEGP